MAVIGQPDFNVLTGDGIQQSETLESVDILTLGHDDKLDSAFKPEPLSEGLPLPRQSQLTVV
jgi:hypothetical protein